MISGGQFRPDGSFTISNVAPGEYTIGVIQTASGLTLAGGVADAISTTVTVAGEDINGLRLIGVKPSTVTGRVILPQATARCNPPSVYSVDRRRGAARCRLRRLGGGAR